MPAITVYLIDMSASANSFCSIKLKNSELEISGIPPTVQAKFKFTNSSICFIPEVPFFKEYKNR